MVPFILDECSNFFIIGTKKLTSLGTYYLFSASKPSTYTLNFTGMIFLCYGYGTINKVEFAAIPTFQYWWSTCAWYWLNRQARRTSRRCYTTRLPVASTLSTQFEIRAFYFSCIYIWPCSVNTRIILENKAYIKKQI